MMYINYSAILFVTYISLVYGFSKYGRTCKDIGCLSNEQCVMETDPCSYYQRDNECGSYPTCKRTNSNQKTCSTFVCPPGNVCKMVGSNPKCVDDTNKRGHIGYDTSSIDNPSNNPSAPNIPPNNAPSAPLYPNLPQRGETTPRPNIQPQNPSGGGYRGQIGSGYPGQNGGYPAQPQYPGYPGYNGYQQPQYNPNQGYQPQYNPNQGYPNNGGYQQPNYNQYPQYNQNQNRYGQKSSGSSISDQLSNTLKNLGTDLLKNALGKLISGATSGRN